MKVWSITVHSESGDDYGVYLFDHKPTEDEMEAFLRKVAPGEWPETPHVPEADYGDEYDGPGFRGSYLYIKGPFEKTVHALKRKRTSRGKM